MIWEVCTVKDTDQDTLTAQLGDGWEPYSTTYVPGAGVLHFLRRRKPKK